MNTSLPHHPKAFLHQFCKKHNNQPGFIIGGGPSLLEYKTPHTKHFLETQVTFGTNRAYEWFSPTYLIAGDSWFWKEYWNILQSLPCWKIGIRDMFPSFHTKNPQFTMMLKRGPSKQVLPNEFCDPISFYNNSGVTALRIAYTLGCNPIYLLGIDLIYPGTERSHWHTGYQKKQQTQKGRYKDFEDQFMIVCKELVRRKITVLSCSPVSPLNKLLPYCDPTTLLQHN